MSVIDQKLIAEFNFSAIVSEKYEEDLSKRLAITTTTRKIEGELAERIRKATGAQQNAPVSVTSVDKYWWDNKNEENGRCEYVFRVQCGAIAKEFDRSSYVGCLAAMVVWTQFP